MRKKMFWEVYRTTESGKTEVELAYSCLHWIGGHKPWFCRLWFGFDFKQAYGKNKFEAYRNAMKAPLQ